MNFSKLLTAFVAGKVGKKLFGRFGKRFGLTPEQVATILAIGIPVLFKMMQNRKKSKQASKKDYIKGNVKS